MYDYIVIHYYSGTINSSSFTRSKDIKLCYHDLMRSDVALCLVVDAMNHGLTFDSVRLYNRT